MIASILQASRVLPVVTAQDVGATVELARALQRGGMGAIEITLRTQPPWTVSVQYSRKCRVCWWRPVP